MDAGLFTKMLSDKSVTDLKKLKYKYPQADLAEFVSLLKGSFYHALPLKDFDGGQMVYLESVAQVRLSAARVLLTPQDSSQPYGIKAMEEEIVSTLSIEQIDTSRDSVRKILSGYAPANESEKRIYAMKKGLEFIVDPAHQIRREPSPAVRDDHWGPSPRGRPPAARQSLPERQRLCGGRQGGAHGPELEETPGVHGRSDWICQYGRRYE